MYRSLWLASWYPSKVSSQNGDFIQRHAQAVSSYANVYVLHVVGMENMSQQIATDRYETPGLTEEIVYYNKKRNGVIGRLFSVYQYFSVYKKHINQYIKKHGRPDIVHVHVSMRAGILALWIKRKYGIPYVVTEHWSVYSKNRNDNFDKQSFLFRFLARKVFKRSSAVLPVSNYLGNSIRQMVASIPFTKVVNVVSDNFYYHRNQAQRECFTFLHVSSLIEIKNPKGIIRAYQQILRKRSDVLLKMVGKNYNELTTYADELHIPKNKIIFVGEISNDDVAKEMQQADAFILFSHSENSPCVVAESLCCGVPVIAADVGGVAELIDESNGILVPAGDETVLANAMQKMLNNYTNYNRDAIARHAAALYNYNTVGKQIFEIYEKTIHK